MIESFIEHTVLGCSCSRLLFNEHVTGTFCIFLHALPQLVLSHLLRGSPIFLILEIEAQRGWVTYLSSYSQTGSLGPEPACLASHCTPPPSGCPCGPGLSSVPHAIVCTPGRHWVNGWEGCTEIPWEQDVRGGRWQLYANGIICFHAVAALILTWSLVPFLLALDFGNLGSLNVVGNHILGRGPIQPP